MWKLIFNMFYTDLIKKNLFPSEINVIKLPKSKLMKDEGVYYLYKYNDSNIRHIIHQIKFFNNKKYFSLLGKELSNYINDEIIIPVPQTKKRLKERGYDVTHTLLKETGKHTNTNDGYGIVENVRKNVQSKIKDRSTRIRSVEGTIKVINKDIIKGNTFIILDDVFTTGSTIREIKKIIEENGGTVSMCICIAH